MIGIINKKNNGCQICYVPGYHRSLSLNVYNNSMGTNTWPCRKLNRGQVSIYIMLQV